ncbi:hypothetical protein [Halomonas sp. Mc5H-6]|uniref:hypothetical protein n=1 Tax=Halomonas sp. Mc5H-6 TaxID=2954500 RepID=UPI0020982CFF|nr:hypothetical protein [Halomonas sp. Mc5H-6]MCO7246380.1 hypothetical protein [Halomonas sp. Mc5H-6]
MIGTHSAKMFNARLKQPGVRASIVGDVPLHLVCSKTVDQRQRFFSMPSNAVQIKEERDRLLIPDETMVGGVELPDLTDGRVKQLLVPLHQWRVHDDYLTLTPLPSAGVLHELWHRLYDLKLPYRKWAIQPTPAAWANHGDPLSVQRGAVRMLRRGVADVKGGSQWRGNFVCLRARVEGMNISSGMVAVGFPAVTGLGGLVHAVERQVDQELEFAFGMKNCQWQSVKRTTNTRVTGKKVAVTPGYTTDEITANGDVVLLIRRKDGGRHTGLDKRLLALTRLCGGSLHDAEVTLHSDACPPDVAYLLDASDDMRRDALGLGDSLDAALHMYGKDGRWVMGEWSQPRNGYTLNASGYAFLEEPKERELARGGYKHAWCETVYSLVTQGAMSNAAWWSRSVNDWGVNWHEAS